MLQAPEVAQCLLICAAFSVWRESPVPATRSKESGRRGACVAGGRQCGQGGSRAKLRGASVTPVETAALNPRRRRPRGRTEVAERDEVVRGRCGEQRRRQGDRGAHGGGCRASGRE